MHIIWFFFKNQRRKSFNLLHKISQLVSQMKSGVIENYNSLSVNGKATYAKVLLVVSAQQDKQV